jgi:ketosteroid isomerase-like protein
MRSQRTRPFWLCRDSNPMSPTETVRTFNAALGRGDASAALTLLSDKLDWTEADGFPFFSGTWRTPQEVLENLFVPLLQDWETFVADPDSFISAAFEVVAFGVYSGVNRATGRTLAAPFAHRWCVSDGRIDSFAQYTDTILVRRAMPLIKREVRRLSPARVAA